MIKKFVLLLVLISLNRILTESVSNTSISLCDDARDVYYDNYRTKEIRNCGCNSSTCVRKCCQKGFSFSYREEEEPDGETPIGICKKKEEGNFSVPVYYEEIEYSRETENFLIGMLTCNSNETIVTYNHIYSDVHVQIDGSVVLQNGHIKYGSYCIDERKDLTIVKCALKSLVKIRDRNTFITIIAYSISASFLTMTWSVYALLPKRNLHESAFMWHTFSLTITYLAVVGYLTHSIEYFGKLRCYVLEPLVSFLHVASFSWINVICFEIWLTFSTFKGFYMQRKKEKVYIAASIYAWGVPALNLLIMFLLYFFMKKDKGNNCIQWLRSFRRVEELPTIFYFGIMLILAIVDVWLFILTYIHINKIKNETCIVQDFERSNRSKISDEKLKIFTRLLILMGVYNPALERIIFILIINNPTKFSIEVICIVIYYYNASCVCYSVIIFHLFIYKKRMWVLPKERLTKIFSQMPRTVSLFLVNYKIKKTPVPLTGIRNISAEVS